MRLTTLLLAGMLTVPAFSSFAETVYVVRPDVPGVTAGVLPKTAFAAGVSTPADPTTPTGPSQPADSADPAVIYTSGDYYGPIVATAHIDATVKIGGHYHYTSPISGPNLYCDPWMQNENIDYLNYFYKLIDKTGVNLVFVSGNGVHSDKYEVPGTYLFLMDCQTRDLKTGATQRSFETLKIVTTK